MIMKASVPKAFKTKLLSWFKIHKRDLPWRHTKDPYKIWISEVMLQQTTSKAVIPYYKQFLKTFPTLKALAQAKEADIFLLWLGLGYYKRAKNLLNAAKILHKKKSFPKTYKELLILPGFGPYTSRALSSLAFEESVGVLDGNVIRFLSRFYNLSLKSWISSDRSQLQKISDSWAQNQQASQMNQALMEIGSMICRSSSALCSLCPLLRDCQAHKQNTVNQLPLKQKNKQQQLLHWKVYIIQKTTRWAVVQQDNRPFFKTNFAFPGTCVYLDKPPKTYHFIHHIMNYKIFVSIKKTRSKSFDCLWLTQKQLQKRNPSSLIQKIFKHILKS